MKNHILRTALSLTLSGTLLFAPIHSASAGGIPVIDGTNLAQNILTAIRTLQSNVNEATMIANQIRELTELPYSMIDQYRKQYAELFTRVGEVQGLMQDLKNLQKNFDKLYPDLLKQQAMLTGDQIVQATERWLDESRDMMKGAAKTGAQVLKDLPSSQAQTNRLIKESQHAVGNLQVQQAGNQIMAQVAGSLTNLNAQLATYSQAHMSWMTREVQGEMALRNRAKNVMAGYDKGPTTRVPLTPF